jgi:hypothetical protein
MKNITTDKLISIAAWLALILFFTSFIVKIDNIVEQKNRVDICIAACSSTNVHLDEEVCYCLDNCSKENK